MVCYRIYSVCLCFGYIAVFYFQYSHPVGFCCSRCEFESRLLWGWFVSPRTDHSALMCHSFSFQLLPAFLHHYHRLHLRFSTHLSSGFGLQFAVQDVAQYLIPSALLSVQPSQAVAAVECDFGIC